MPKGFPLVLPFISGLIIVFLLTIVGSFLYMIAGNELGWSSLDWELWGLTISKVSIKDNGSFSISWGAGTFVIALFGGFINAVLAYFLKRKQ